MTDAIEAGARASWPYFDEMSSADKAHALAQTRKIIEAAIASGALVPAGKALDTAPASGDYVVVPRIETNEILDALAEECRATWGVNGKEPQKHVPLNYKNEWRERMRPFYRAMLTAACSNGGAK